MENKIENAHAPSKKEPNYRGIKAMPFVIGNETFEKLGTIGTSANLLVYLTTIFNMRSITATNVINIFHGTCNFGTLLGAFLSDTYLGRYKTLGIASICSFLGMLILTLTAAFPTLHPPKCESECVGPSPGQLAFLFTGFVLLVFGASGIRPCNLAFGADQFNPNTESGRKGINSFFNWYYFTFTCAMMLSLTIIVYVQSSVNWAVGLAIPAFMMFLSCAFFFIGTRMYVIVLPKGVSPVTSVVQTLVVAFKKRRLELPEQPWGSLFNHTPSDSINSKLVYTEELRFMNKASILTPEDKINPDGSAANPWNLCSIQQVEEIKCVMRVIPIWLAGVMYYIVISQTQTYFVLQAIQSDRHLGNFLIPAASYTVFSMLSLTIWIPIYDRIIIPLLRKITGKEEGITMLQRIGIGLVFAILTMLTAGLVENYRRNSISTMSGNWFIPQWVLAGLSEAFTIIGEVEFFYKQFPENMRSFAGSFLFCGLAMGSYLSTALVSIVHKSSKVGETSNWLAEDLNKGKLDCFYYLVAGLQVVNLGYFLICAKWYKYKKTDATMNVALEKIDQKLSV